MERKILYGNIKPNDLANALVGEFNRGNLYAQVVGHANKLAVQVATRMGAQSGGQTALTVSIQSVEDGVEGFVTSFEALAQLLWRDEYKDADGLVYPVHLTVQDAMGHRTTEVYDFCRKYRGWILPFKGEARMAAAIAYSKIDHYPGKAQPIPGGPLQLLRANVNVFKSNLAVKLEIAPADPGAWHLHGEADVEWARQMTAEYIDPETQEWTAIEGRRNHAWDVSVYNLVAAYACGLRFWPTPTVGPEQAPRPRQPKPSRW